MFYNSELQIHESPIDFFIGKMNEKSHKLELANTHFNNTHGLCSKTNYSTCYDVSLLCNYALQNTMFSKIVNTQSWSCTLENKTNEIRTIVWKNTNKLLAKGFSGVKTGVTDMAGPCLAASTDFNDKKYVFVLLNCSGMNTRFLECIKLYKNLQKKAKEI